MRCLRVVLLARWRSASRVAYLSYRLTCFEYSLGNVSSKTQIWILGTAPLKCCGLWPYILLYCMKGLAYLLSFAREITLINWKHRLRIIVKIHSEIKNLNNNLRCVTIPTQLKACSRTLPSPFRTIEFPPRLGLRPNTFFIFPNHWLFPYKYKKLDLNASRAVLMCNVWNHQKPLKCYENNIASNKQSFIWVRV